MPQQAGTRRPKSLAAGRLEPERKTETQSHTSPRKPKRGPETSTSPILLSSDDDSEDSDAATPPSRTRSDQGVPKDSMPTPKTLNPGAVIRSIPAPVNTSSDAKTLAPERLRNGDHTTTTSDLLIEAGAVEDAGNKSIQSESDADMPDDGSIAVPMAPSGPDNEAETGDSAPTFGDLMSQRDAIDVPSISSKPRQAANGVTKLSQRAPRGFASLGNALSQALRTDDKELLETCLQVNNSRVIRSTLEKMDSTLAGRLLSKLAARFHKRPGRAHALLVFMQWTLVIHGGILLSDPDTRQKLAELKRILGDRAQGFNNLNALKGRLDMLYTQMKLRKAHQIGRSARHSRPDASAGKFANRERGIIYVEGDEMQNESRHRTNGQTEPMGDDELMSDGEGGGSDGDSEDYDDLDQDAADDLDDEEIDAALHNFNADHFGGDDSSEEDDSPVETEVSSRSRKTKGTSRR